MAEEVLQGVVSSICTRTITVNAPGVTRFLNESECTKIMKEMETKFTVYIRQKFVPWEYLPHQVTYGSPLGPHLFSVSQFSRSSHEKTMFMFQGIFFAYRSNHPINGV